MHSFTRRTSFIAVLVVAAALIPSIALAQGGGGQYGQYGQYNGQYNGHCDDADCFPRKGVEAGYGGSASDGSSPLALVLGGGVVLAATAAGTGLALRRRRT